MERKYGKATRDAYGQAIVELGKTNSDVVVMDADLSKSTKSACFEEVFPDRFINVGIQEANLVGVASGLAACGKIPFISSFATFITSKGFDQFRMAVAFSEFNVKCVASHGGISIGEDGASQMSIEDYALMTSLPGFKVIVPADEISMKKLTPEIASIDAPVYVRTGRPKAPIIHDENTEFKIGKAIRVKDGKDVSIIANGLMVAEALEAAEKLEAEGISVSVVDMHTIKPLDEAILVEESKKTGRVVVCEEHQIWGGLGSAVARFLSEHAPCKMGFVAIQDTFAGSGVPYAEIFEKYGLSSSHVMDAVKKTLN